MPNMPSTSAPASNNGGKKALFIVVVVIVLILLIAAFFVFNKKEAGQPKPENINKNISEGSETGFPDEFFSYTGNIIEVNDGYITITATAAKNYLASDKEIKVNYDGATTFVNITVNNPRTDTNGKLFTRTPIEVGDLKVGDEITVISSENVAGKTEFTAKQIELR